MSLNNYHFPAVLERNAIFRKLFLFRKLFFTRRKSSHYSQFGEDVTIGRQFPADYVGYYVDVGCYHPIKHSNTYALYKRGWAGINIDIDEIKIEGFNLLRKRDVNVVSAVSDRNGEVEYYSAGMYSLITTLDKDFACGRSCYRKKTTTARRLDEIIAGTRFAGREIDLLNVDVESHDFQVLSSLDFARYRPKVVVVETHLPTFEDVSGDDVYRFLTERDYTLVNWCVLSLVFRRRDWNHAAWRAAA